MILLWLILKNRLFVSGLLLTQAADIDSLEKPASINGKNFTFNILSEASPKTFAANNNCSAIVYIGLSAKNGRYSRNLTEVQY